MFQHTPWYLFSHSFTHLVNIYLLIGYSALGTTLWRYSKGQKSHALLPLWSLNWSGSRHGQEAVD